MDEEYAKAYDLLFDSIVIWETNLRDILKKIIGNAPVYVHLQGFDYEFSIDGAYNVTEDNIKQIEQETGAEYLGHNVDYVFEYTEEVVEL